MRFFTIIFVIVFFYFFIYRNWLFGEKEGIQPVINGKDNRIRGWFPRPCAIPVFEKDKDLDNYDIDSDLNDPKYLYSNTYGVSKSTEIEPNYLSQAHKKKRK